MGKTWLYSHLSTKVLLEQWKSAVSYFLVCLHFSSICIVKQEIKSSITAIGTVSLYIATKHNLHF